MNYGDMNYYGELYILKVQFLCNVLLFAFQILMSDLNSGILTEFRIEIYLIIICYHRFLSFQQIFSKL